MTDEVALAIVREIGKRGFQISTVTGINPVVMAPKNINHTISNKGEMIRVQTQKMLSFNRLGNSWENCITHMYVDFGLCDPDLIPKLIAYFNDVEKQYYSGGQ